MAGRKDSPLCMTDVDHVLKKLCETMVSFDRLPQFSAILNQNESEHVDVDDFDLLQWELEALLSAVAVRSRVLEKEISSLNCIDDTCRELSEESCSSLSSMKQVDAHNKPQKRVREVSSKSDGICEIPIQGNSVKVKKFSDIPSAEPRFKQEEKLPQLSQRRYEPPNKFWTSMNPFCTDISYQDLKFLEELIEKYESNQDILKIPLLGRHYSERWAEEELTNEQFESHFEGKNKAKRTVTPMESYMLLKKAKNSVFGPTPTPLAERCISALLEENIEVPQNESKFLGESKSCKSGFVSKEYGFLNLEERILRALESEDILDCNFEQAEIGDEILQEIKNCQTEMEVINNYNVSNLKRLLKLAKVEVSRQDLRRKLEMVDNEVFENYRLLLASKQKKTPLSKSLQERCWNSLKERDELKRQLDSFSDD